MDTGASKSTVVTLSRNADSTAVNKHMITTNVHICPLHRDITLTVATSKNPVLDSFPTRIIIPNRSDSAPSSIHSSNHTQAFNAQAYKMI